MVSKQGETVGTKAARKGYEIEPGTFVVIQDNELDKLKPKESRAITLKRFVPMSALGDEWYERGYYLGPDGSDAEYFALVEALSEADLLGITRWTMRGREYVGALRVESECLLLVKLRYAEEILPADELKAPPARPLDAKELRMADELVDVLAGPFKPEEFHDEYAKRLHDFIEAKAKGKHPRLAVVKNRASGAPLEDQLAKSLVALNRAKGRKVA
jgi:DNA end-binding protein Ku